jgi:[acyl-carrier-protein] S-malonyltransferase
MSKLAFVFPGQGSQSVGMMAGYGEEARKAFAEASQVLDEDLWRLVERGPADALNLTVNTQPVMLTAGIAAYRTWLARAGAKPAVLAGHSLGEFTALVAAAALDFGDALKLVRVRAQAMQEAVPQGEGAMAAILGLSDERVAEACSESAQGEVVQPVNFNAPSQVVIAGHRAAVERAMEAARAKGARRVVALPVSGPFHSDLMRPAAEKLSQYLEELALRTPEIPVLHNADVVAYSDTARIKDALVRQLHSPVRWVETIQHLVRENVTHIVECGPGKVLLGMVKRIEGGFQSLALTDTQAIDAALETLK